MRKLLSIKYSAAAFNIAMLLLRTGFGLALLIKHGLPKLMKFATLQNEFYNFMGMGSKFSLILAIFAEVFCSLFIILGLFTRFAVIPLIVTMLVVIYGADKGKGFFESELAIMFLTAFLTLLLCGPGRISVDGMMNN
ncbi:DoxX family protein [Foetidibacter luteolus]|uniref:DoxX family protein n=1 Tax=Foetidibacter luteolus TaxID=2608880 RepID=UPI001A9887ED|nr:DoxX family protein [Foetidibacter luteolus]